MSIIWTAIRLEKCEVTAASLNCYTTIVAVQVVCTVLQGAPVSNGSACDICKLIVPELEEKLKDKSSIDAIEKALDSTCDKFPAMRSQCKNVVKDYLPLILNAIFQLPAENLCSSIHLCSSSKSLQAPLLTLPAENEIVCAACIAVFAGLKSFLGNEYVQGNITDFVSKACDILPQQSICKFVVKLYIPKAINDIVNIPPKDDCEFFGLCSNSSLLLW